MEWCSPCPLCWVRLQVSPIGWASWCIQHNWQRQGHSIRFRCGVADSMIKKIDWCRTDACWSLLQSVWSTTSDLNEYLFLFSLLHNKCQTFPFEALEQFEVRCVDIVHGGQQGKDAIISPTNWNWMILDGMRHFVPLNPKIGRKDIVINVIRNELFYWWIVKDYQFKNQLNYWTIKNKLKKIWRNWNYLNNIAIHVPK
jgi:hypothetical protein